MKKQPFFWADMAGLGKYHMGGYGRTGVYRVKFSHTDPSAQESIAQPRRSKAAKIYLYLNTDIQMMLPAFATVSILKFQIMFDKYVI